MKRALFAALFAASPALADETVCVFPGSGAHQYTMGHVGYEMVRRNGKDGVPLVFQQIGGLDELDGCDAGLRVSLQTGVSSSVDWTLFTPDKKVSARGTETCGAAAKCFREIREKLVDHVNRMALKAEAPRERPGNTDDAAYDRMRAAAGMEPERREPKVASEVDTPTYASKPRPDDFAVVVGIEDYPNLPKAKHAARDADAVKAHMKALGVPERNIISLTGAAATRGKLAAYLDEWLPKNVKPESRVFFYYSGHGAPDPKTGQAYIVPADGDPMFLQSTAYPLKDVYAKLAKLPAKQVVVALDACFSGAGGRSVLADGARPLVTKTADVSPTGNVSVLAAASGDEITGGLDEQGHGMFTYFLLKGLSEGKRSTKDLLSYVKPLVQDEARRQNREQTPVLLGQNLGF